MSSRNDGNKSKKAPQRRKRQQRVDENEDVKDQKELVMEELANSQTRDKLYRRLDDDQRAAYHAIIGDKQDVVFMDCPAGTGKTLLACLGGLELLAQGRINGFDYIRIPSARGERLGYTPGGLIEKEAKYMRPIYETLMKCGLSWGVIAGLRVYKMLGVSTDIELRGTTFEKRLVFVDEAQNGTLEDLKLIFTRVMDKGGKLVVAGHSGQLDSRIPRICGLLPFEVFKRHGQGIPWIGIYELRKNYRGRVSQWADSVEKTIKELVESGVSKQAGKE